MLAFEEQSLTYGKGNTSTVLLGLPVLSSPIKGAAF